MKALDLHGILQDADTAAILAPGLHERRAAMHAVTYILALQEALDAWAMARRADEADFAALAESMAPPAEVRP